MDPTKNSFWSRNIPHSAPSTPSEEIFVTPNNSIIDNSQNDSGIYGTPLLTTQFSNCSVNSDIFGTPDTTIDEYKLVELRKKNGIDNKMTTINESVSDNRNLKSNSTPGVIRSKSDYEIPLKNKSHQFLQNLSQNILNNLSPATRRRNHNNSNNVELSKQSTPTSSNNKPIFKIPGSPILSNYSNNNREGAKAISLSSLRHSSGDTGNNINFQQIRFVLVFYCDNAI